MAALAPFALIDGNLTSLSPFDGIYASSTHQSLRYRRAPFDISSLLFGDENVSAARKRRRKKRKRISAQGSKPQPYKVAKTTPRPSAIFFPTNEDEGCGEVTAMGSGFNTFGFLAMMIAAFNAVNLVASNINDRNNNYMPERATDGGLGQRRFDHTE